MGVRSRAAGATDLAARLGRAGRDAFVGRDAERELVAAALAGEPDFAVLFLHGPGGIGKSALLRRMVLDADATARVTPVVLDARTFAPSPEGFLAALAAELDVPEDEDPVRALHQADRLLLVLDTFERCSGLQGWLRERFLPRLPADAVTVLAGRHPPEAAWRLDPLWGDLLRVIALRNLPPGDAGRLLTARGVAAHLHRDALAFTGGHPLALCLVAETAAGNGYTVPPSPSDAPDLLRVLLGRIVDEAPSPRHRAALEVCAHARVTTESLLRAVLPGPGTDELFQWLCGRSFVEAASDGLYPHDLAREVLDAELRWRDPDRYADLHRRIRSYLDRQRSRSGDGTRAWRDLMFLDRHSPVFAPFLSWEVEGGVYEDAPGPDDARAMLAMTRAAEGEESATVLAYWLDRRPEGCRVYRRAGQAELCGFALHLRLAAPDAGDLAIDPVVAAAWAHVDAVGRLRPGEQVDLLRTFVVPEAYHRPSPAMDLIQAGCAQGWTSPPGSALTFLTLADPEFWAPQMAYIDHHRAGEAAVGGRTFTLFAHDWRAVPPAAWFDAVANRELGGGSGPAAPVPDPARLRAVLSAEEFEAAVKDALRSRRRPGDLAHNPLCRSRLVADVARGRPAAEVLAELLVEATDTLAEDPGAAKLHRVLATTFFRGVPTQEAAAERLGLPFSTYRRQLAAGTARVTAWLWERELHGSGQEVSTDRPVG